MDDTQDNIALLRPYTPDLLSFLGNFGAVTAYYDGNGHYARVHPAAQNIFDYADNGGAGDTLDPVYTDPAVQFDDIQFGLFRRCPGGGAPPAADGSNPFLDGGALGAGDCDPSALPPGP